MLENLDAFIKLLNKHKVKYTLIGGMAILLHGGRATTLDFDFYILAFDFELLQKILKKYNLKNAGEHQFKVNFKGTPIDILLADPILGEQVIKRSKMKKIGEQSIKVATPEDLILLKSIADRPIDRRDIEELKEIFKEKLDQRYINKELNRLKKLLS